MDGPQIAEAKTSTIRKPAKRGTTLKSHLDGEIVYGEIPEDDAPPITHFDAPPKRQQKAAKVRKPKMNVPLPARVPVIPSPAGSWASSLRTCAACNWGWNVSDREEVNGELIPIHFRSFLTEDVRMPVLTIFIDPDTNLKTGDIWPILPVVTRRWLCINCYHAEWEAGLASWCNAVRDSDLSSPTGAAIRYAEQENLEIPEMEILPEDDIQLGKWLYLWAKYGR